MVTRASAFAFKTSWNHILSIGQQDELNVVAHVQAVVELGDHLCAFRLSTIRVIEYL